VFDHTATLLPNGQVLVAGGIVQVGVFTAELYDPVAGTFTETGSLTTPRYEHSATLLNDGTVLMVGGRVDGSTVLNTAELYQ
jgi:Galactose oxidase, central domain